MQQALPTLPSLGSATVSRCVHYSCRPSCPPRRTQTLAASGATSVDVSYAPATWWKHQPSTAPPPRNHFKSATDLHVKVLMLCTFSTATPANNHNTWEKQRIHSRLDSTSTVQTSTKTQAAYSHKALQPSRLQHPRHEVCCSGECTTLTNLKIDCGERPFGSRNSRPWLRVA